MTSPPPLDLAAPAKLFRSPAHWPEEVHLHPMEEIGNGSLEKMVRIVRSDPDQEYWVYAIEVGGHRHVGDAILTLSLR